jgi:glycosyltransferase involved in cell wall biosynthesis
VRKTNVLILASSLRIGGAESVMQHLALTIDRSRFNVTVCYLKQRGQVGEELARAGIDIVGVLDSDRPDYFTFRKLLRILRQRRIDVVHTHTTHGLVDACLCKLFLWRLRVVHTFHFGNYPHTGPRIIWMERVFSRLADRLFAVGEAQRTQLKAVFGFDDDDIGVIWNGVNPPSGGGDPLFRATIGANGSVLIGTIATLIEQKGLRDLMHVARRVLDAGANAKFVIVGEGQLRKELELLRHELGLEESVILTGWMTNAAERVLPTVDIFFQPSLWEAMSVVTLEAMACERAIVATTVGATPQILAHDIDAILVEPRDRDAMANALLRLINDGVLRTRLGAAAGSKARSKFTVGHMTAMYEAAYLDAPINRRS